MPASSEAGRLRVVVAGLGSIGRRHLANLRILEPRATITVWRHRQQADDEVTAGADGAVYGDDPRFEGAPDCAIVAGPSSTHMPTALTLAQHGAHLLVEKPISNDMAGVDQLISVCRERGLALATGYNLRFLRPLQVLRAAVVDGRIGRVVSVRAEVGQYLPDWPAGPRLS